MVGEWSSGKASQPVRLQHGKKEKRKGRPQSNTGKMKRGAGRGRRQTQWRGEMNTRGRKAAWTVRDREKRKESRPGNGGIRCWCVNMPLGCKEKNRNAGTETPE